MACRGPVEGDWVREPPPPPPNWARTVAQRPKPTTERTFVGLSNVSAYTLAEKLGEGTFGVVFKAVRRDPDAGKVRKGDVVALKEILLHNQSDGMPITSLREIRILKSLDHPAVVPVVDMVFEEGIRETFTPGKTFMVFPYMDHDLAGLLENPLVKLETPHIKQYSKQLLQGTAYLHQNGILHRDMKAANLLINNEGSLMIADFGLARSIWRASANREYTNLVVTRWYRPPELLLGEKKYHTSVDMWGVGCVMLEMYHKKPVFPGTSDIDQCEKIFSLCGSPDEINMPGWSKLGGCEGRNTWERRQRTLANFVTPMGGEMFTDLMEKILLLDPKKRLTAEQALQHDWFWTDPLPTEPKQMPKYNASHELDRRQRDEVGYVNQQKQATRAPLPQPHFSHNGPLHPGAMHHHGNGRPPIPPAMHSGGRPVNQLDMGRPPYGPPNGVAGGYLPPGHRGPSDGSRFASPAGSGRINMASMMSRPRPGVRPLPPNMPPPRPAGISNRPPPQEEGGLPYN